MLQFPALLLDGSHCLPALPYPAPPPLQWDIAAGLSVAAMVIPQGLSYANIAGLPNVYGLYGSFVPCMVYALFGTSKQLVRLWQCAWRLC